MHDENIDPQFAEYVEAADWQKAHRREDFVGDTFPVGGFGPDGKHTLWLPPAEPPTRIRRVDGRFKRVLLLSAMTTPEMLDLKRQARRSIRTADGKVYVGTEYFDYATAVIRASYSVTDDEMRMLLSGRAWHKPMMLHLGEGEQLVRLSTAMKGQLV